MGKNSHQKKTCQQQYNNEGSSFPEQSSSFSEQSSSFPEQSETLHDQGSYSGSEVQIELDYQELLKNRTLRDKRSNILIRLAADEPGVKKRPEKLPSTKKKHNYQQINTKDITDIIVIVLLVLILGVQLFRVVMQVQVQFRNAQKQLHYSKQGQNSLSAQSANNQNTQPSNPTQPPKQPQITITLTDQCQKHIDSLLHQHGSLYDFKYPDREMKIKSRLDNFVEGKNLFVNREKYAEAITLLRVVHHVDGRGGLVVVGDACEEELGKRERLVRVMSQQLNRWNSEYQIDLYHSRQLPFCLVVNSYNNAQSGLIYRNIDSILQQNYTNYHIAYTDDASTDFTGVKVQQYLTLKSFPQSRLSITTNPTKSGMMQNIYQAVHNHCKDGEIVVMLDGDDSLVGVNVLGLLNAVYQKERPAVMWANFVSIFNNNQVAMGFSRDYSEKQKADGSFRKMKGFISSHLKTFYTDMFKKIKPEDLQLNSGKFYGGASDTAMMLPMIEMANPRIKYLPEILYEYRYDTGQTGNVVNKVPQKEALAKIFATKVYQKLKDFSFIDRAIQAAVDIQAVEKGVRVIQMEAKVVHEEEVSELSTELDDTNHK